MFGKGSPSLLTGTLGWAVIMNSAREVGRKESYSLFGLLWQVVELQDGD